MSTDNSNAELVADWFAQYHERLIAAAQAITRNRQDAEDCVSNLYLKMLTKGSALTFEGRSEALTFLYRCAINEALMLLRSKRRRGEVPLADAAMVDCDRLEASVMRVDLGRAVNALASGYAKVFIQYDVMGVTHADVATAAGRAVGTQRSQLFKARRAMRKRLPGY